MPSRAELAATCVWPGLEGQVLALSGALHQPGLSCAMLQYMPASGSFQVMVRSSTPEVIQAVQSNSMEWLSDLTLGALQPGVGVSYLTTSAQQSALPKPPTHPSVVECLQRYQLSCQALVKANSSLSFMVPFSPDELAEGGVAATSGSSALIPAGPRVGQGWLKGAALAEWRRLAAVR
eukprot:gene8746-33606_t